MKYSFLFGAGAEVDFGLPLGNVFALRTILKDNKRLYKALKIIFKDYKKEKVFPGRDSVDFRSCVFETIKKIKESNINAFDDFELNQYYTFEKQVLGERIENLNQSSKDKIKDLYDGIKKLSEEDFKSIFNNDVPKEALQLICKEFEYRGNIEKDFYSLIDKDSYGKGKYYRIFNYLWSSYFSILIPILKKDNKYKGYVKDNSIEYEYILNNLEEIIKYIFSYDLLSNYNNTNSYYKDLLQFKDEIYCVMTTNYTPFVELYYKNKTSKDSICYLSGRLDLFEDSKDNIVFNLNDKKDSKDYFPFIMTQAPIKPIVNPIQIKEYYHAITGLEESDCLVIVGYSMCDNDYHILSIIKDFIVKNNKYLIYCAYNSNKSESIIKDEIASKIRVSNNNDIKDRMFIIKHNKEDNDLYLKINNKMKEVK